MSTEVFDAIRQSRNRGKVQGIYSVCSSHSMVLETAIRRVAQNNLPVLIEATANQVNQFGGYTGLTPAQFADRLKLMCHQNNLDDSKIIFGGDHLGPHPWRNLAADHAMEEAQTLVAAFVAAGATKIHLDASMALGGDQGTVPAPTLAAERAALLCQAAEREFRSRLRQNPLTRPPVYIVGTEVPVPGGTPGGEPESGPLPTQIEAFHQTVELHRQAFAARGLDDAWDRVVAVVVQPGFEFDEWQVFPYQPERAAPLCAQLSQYPQLVFEGHSTDFQSQEALCAMVRDGVAILKVGPGLTFALRSSLLGLSYIDAELAGFSGAPDLFQAICREMESDPKYWRGYYQEHDRNALLYSYSDRIRYYWDRPRIRDAVDRLFTNLHEKPIPASLLAQFLPQIEVADAAILEKRDLTPEWLVSYVIDLELKRYERACYPETMEETHGLGAFVARQKRFG